jgi:hypothetical protein
VTLVKCRECSEPFNGPGRLATHMRREHRQELLDDEQPEQAMEGRVEHQACAHRDAEPSPPPSPAPAASPVMPMTSDRTRPNGAGRLGAIGQLRRCREQILKDLEQVEPGLVGDLVRVEAALDILEGRVG